MKKLRIIVSGYIGLYPSGGVTWDYIQYPLGLKLLGHDVFYFEDTHQYPVFQKEGSKWDDCSASLNYLNEVMSAVGLGDRWAYRDEATGNWFGLSEERVADILKTADVFINVSASTYVEGHDYDHIPVKVLIDSDPMFTQIQYWEEETEGNNIQRITETFKWYTHLFSFGENIGETDCLIPTYGFRWKTTRQPVCIKEWVQNKKLTYENAFTTIMNWSARSPIKYKKAFWGQKDVEFLKFKKIPSIFAAYPFQVVIACAIHAKNQFDKYGIEKEGWCVFEPENIVGTPHYYKNFIFSSFGEFSVAKEAYVKSNSGWFSCRSACYLAAGKPVITQETQWSKFIPAGKGLFSFEKEETALDALRKVSSNYATHSKAAIDIAKEYFDSHIVLKNLIIQL